MNFILPHCGHCRTSWTSAWRMGASRGRTKTGARLVANQWEVRPWRSQRIDVGRPDGTRDSGWGYPWRDSRRNVKMMGKREVWLGLRWVLLCSPALHFIGLCLPSHPGCVFVHVLYTPLPSITSPAHLCSDSANRLIFLEQWCQLFIHPSPLIVSSDCDWLCLSLCHSVSPFSRSWGDIGSEYCWCPCTHSPGNTPVWISVCVCVRLCVFVWGIAARALACCASSASSFGFVCRLDVSLNGNWWVCMGQH